MRKFQCLFMKIKMPPEDRVLKIHRLKLDEELKKIESEIKVYENILKRGSEYGILNEREQNYCLKYLNDLRKKYFQFLEIMKIPEEDIVFKIYRLKIEIEMNERILKNSFSESEREEVKIKLKNLKEKYQTLVVENFGIPLNLIAFLKKLFNSKYPIQKEKAFGMVSPSNILDLERREIISLYKEKIFLTGKGRKNFQKLEKMGLI